MRRRPTVLEAPRLRITTRHRSQLPSRARHRFSRDQLMHFTQFRLQPPLVVPTHVARETSTLVGIKSSRSVSNHRNTKC
jgi:hypothetical protein